MQRTPIVFPVRFATHQAAVQTTTRELATDGVFVRCLASPPLGAAIAMRLYLPGAREAVSATGLVREVTVEGAVDSKEAGFWAEFLELEAAAQTRIDEALRRRQRAAEATPIGAIALQPASADDPRRSFRRYTARFAVRFASVQEFVVEYAENISAGGVFVQTLDPPPMNSIIRVEMELPGGGPPVPARALVVHRVTPEEARERGVLPGVGVQFVDADDRFRERIDAAIEHILATKE